MTERWLTASQKMLKCVICELVFKEEDALDLHIQKQHFAQTFQCSICDQIYLDNNALQGHVRYMHLPSTSNSPKDLECLICSDKFPTDESLKAHIKRMHSEQREIICKLCHISFQNIANLNAHM